MIGLEYILKIYNKTQQKLADELGIKRQNIDAWIRGIRPIPKKYYKQLGEIFVGIDSKYFSKKLSRLDELEIQMEKLNSSWIEEEYEEEVIDPFTGETEVDENGEVVIRKGIYTERGQQMQMDYLQYEIDKAKMINKIEQTFAEQIYKSQMSEEYMQNDELTETYAILELYELFIKIIQKAGITRNTLRCVLNSVIAYQDDKLKEIAESSNKSENDMIIEKIGKIISDEENRVREQAEYWLEMTKGLDDLFK